MRVMEMVFARALGTMLSFLIDALLLFHLGFLSLLPFSVSFLLLVDDFVFLLCRQRVREGWDDLMVRMLLTWVLHVMNQRLYFGFHWLKGLWGIPRGKTEVWDVELVAAKVEVCSLHQGPWLYSLVRMCPSLIGGALILSIDFQSLMLGRLGSKPF